MQIKSFVKIISRFSLFGHTTLLGVLRVFKGAILNMQMSKSSPLIGREQTLIICTAL